MVIIDFVLMNFFFQTEFLIHHYVVDLSIELNEVLLLFAFILYKDVDSR